MLRIYSFDVFDTCLTRKTAAPAGVFFHLAVRILAGVGISPSRPQTEDFVAARINAERQARKNSKQEDVSLEEIWRILCAAMGWSYDETFLTSELQAESESLLPIAVMRQRVAAVRKKGHRIIFISDMYLPTEFIKKQLFDHDFFKDGDGLYVSGEIGKTKATGNLFRHVLAEEKAPPAEILHTGDNRLSDYVVPRKLGIRAELFDESKFTPVEVNLLRMKNDALAMNRLVGAMRAFRLGCELRDEKDINELASQFIAPFVMGFATWILRRAQQDGVKRLYFMSRDSQLVWKVARELSPQFGGIDCLYLYVSRQALFLPSSSDISPEGMPWIRREFETPSLKSLLARVELQFDDIKSHSTGVYLEKGESTLVKFECDWRDFWNLLNQGPVKAQIESRIAERKNTARQYFESVGLLDDVPWAIVDLGWYLNCQRALWNLLRNWNEGLKIKGYYLALRSQRLGPAVAGMAEGLFYELTDHLGAEKISALFSYQTLLEHIVGCADHPTVHHYEIDTKGHSRAAHVASVSEADATVCRKIHEQVLDFTRQNCGLAETFRDVSVCRESLELIAEKFFVTPTKRAAVAVSGLSVAKDQNSLDAMPILKPMTLGTIIFMVLPRRWPFIELRRMSDCFWWEGALTVTPFIIRPLAMFAKRIADVRSKLHRLSIG